MATQHIDFPSTASRYSALMRQVIDQARRMQNNVTEAVDVANQIAADSDWAALATALGVDAAEAQAVYNLLIAFQSVINKAAYDTFIDRLG